MAAAPAALDDGTILSRLFLFLLSNARLASGPRISARARFQYLLWSQDRNKQFQFTATYEFIRAFVQHRITREKNRTVQQSTHDFSLRHLKQTNWNSQNHFVHSSWYGWPLYSRPSYRRRYFFTPQSVSKHVKKSNSCGKTNLNG